VLEERDQRRGDAHDLLRRDVDVVDLARRHLAELAVDTGQHDAVLERAVLSSASVGARTASDLLVGAEVLDLRR
jgi:hypothetical protein